MLQYLHYSLSGLPAAYSSLDTNRLTLVHFIVQSLALNNDTRLLGPSSSSKVIRERLIDWILNLYVTTPTSTMGFVGGTFSGSPFSPSAPSPGSTVHIAMTYCALLTLLALDCDLSNLDAQGIMEGVKSLQNLDHSKSGNLYGSFSSHSEGSESDMRFNYCAVVIERVLWKCINPGVEYDPRDSTYIDKDALLEYCRGCRCYDGGVGLVPGLESHGGSYFTCLATLTILDSVRSVFPSDGDVEGMKRWGLMRQVKGMQGRCNKKEDTCYSYWVGGGIELLRPHTLDGKGAEDMLNTGSLSRFVVGCQHGRFGGFGKTADAPPDVLHTFYSLAYLAMVGGTEGIGGVSVVYGAGRKVGEWIEDERSYEVLKRVKEQGEKGGE